LNRILVIALAGIGDTLMATPLIHELRANFPAATIDALVLWPGARQILEGNPHLNTVHQHHFLKSSKLASLRFVLGLRRQRYDVSFNVHPQARTEYRLIARSIGAQRRLSHRYDRWTWLDQRLFPDAVPQDYTVHADTNNLRLLEAAGGRQLLERHAYELFLAEPEQRWAAEFLRKNGLEGRRWLGIHVGSGGTKNLALRRWPLDRYVELVALLRAQQPDLPVVFFGGPEEAEAHATLFQRLRQGPVFFPQSPGLRHAAALLGHAHAFLSVDTVFMHLAAAVQVPHQFVIETPTINPPILPLRETWELIPNPRVAGRGLEFYRYDGLPIRGTDAQLRQIMESVTAELAWSRVGRVFNG
jgi:ADP-heptose:LPS heptosyltransferase